MLSGFGAFLTSHNRLIFYCGGRKTEQSQHCSALQTINQMYSVACPCRGLSGNVGKRLI